jgi:hypothetical protein
MIQRDSFGMLLCYAAMMRVTHRGVRTMVEIPEALWEEAKRRALDERTSLKALLVEGLELRLKKAVKKGGRK